MTATPDHHVNQRKRRHRGNPDRPDRRGTPARPHRRHVAADHASLLREGEAADARRHAGHDQHPREPKNPQAEYESCFYRLADGGYGFPADAFKQATVGAARFYGKAVTMTALKQFIFVSAASPATTVASWCPSSPPSPSCARTSCALARGTDLRYRPSFYPWAATLEVVYFTSVIRQESVISLIDAGGMAIGVGEWRPERDGTFGTYKVDQSKQVEVTR
jgi:hypothetical protein